MLYLAEVNKKNQGLLSLAKTELLLLACKSGSQHWKVLSQSKKIPAKEANDFSDGTLVVVDLSDNNQQIGQIEPAKNCIIKLLRNYLILKEKYRQQEQDIEHWQQSLKYQAEELNQQKLELEMRLQQLEAKEEELKLTTRPNQPINQTILEDSNPIFPQKLIGTTLQEADLISPAQMEIALTTQANYPELTIGYILALRGWIKPETVDFFVQQWSTLLDQQQKYQIGYYLKQAGLLNDEQIKLLLVEQKKVQLRLGAIAVLKGWLRQKTLNFFLENLFPEYQNLAVVRS